MTDPSTDIGRDDVLVSWMPLHHDFGLVLFLFGPAIFGTTTHLLQPRLTNLRRWMTTIEREGGTVTAAPDFAYRAAARLLADDDLDLSGLRIAFSGGEPVRATTVERFERTFGVPGVVTPGYGLAEATLGVTMFPVGARERTDPEGTVSCGPPLPDIEVRIVDEHGADAAPGARGQVVVRAPGVFAGYWGDPSATDRVLRDGWLFTGDIGHLDEEGHLYVVGRQRAMIKRAGRLIPARAVEEVVDLVPGVRRSGAIGVETGPGRDEDLVVVAEVARATGGLEREIERAVRSALGFVPAAVQLVGRGQVPLTKNGKLRHVELKRRYLSGLTVATG